MKSTAALPPEHDSFIAWPNGAGETPCSALYAKTGDDFDDAQNLATQAEGAENWEAWGEHSTRAAQLADLLAELRATGHLGQREEYSTPCPLTALIGGASMTASGDVFHNDALVGRIAVPA